jgi:hypothetical protein
MQVDNPEGKQRCFYVVFGSDKLQFNVFKNFRKGLKIYCFKQYARAQF